MRFLITGFEPFGQETVNSSWEAVKVLPKKIESAKVIKECLPVSFKGAVEKLEQLIELHHPDVVLNVGQSAGRYEINVERIAINMADSKKGDNDNYCPKEYKIHTDAPNAYFSNLPVSKLVEAIQNAGIPAVVSNSAGLYVCNSVFFSAMHLVHCKYPNMQVGFIHIPNMPCQTIGKTRQPSMAVETMSQALKTIVRTIVNQ